MKKIEEDYKYPIIIFIFVIIITAFIASFSLAYNPDKYQDTDGDGLTDYEEKAIYQTYWYDKDTDKDGYDDGVEVANGYSPKHPKLKMHEADTDNDGLNDKWEILLGANLMVRDTDGDGYLDGTEVYHGYSPTDPQPVKISKKIEINLAEFKLDFYIDNILMDTFPISAGKKNTPTPTGEFIITAKYPLKHYNYYPNTKWNLQFASLNGLNYYIHGAYWHDKFGEENLSGGCVNVKYEDMERLYIFSSVGTPVIIK